MSSRLDELLQIMARLRAPEGCPWDREQDFASIAPFTIEEAYEVADAIDRANVSDLKDELGDLLFQVVFHSQIASEARHFDFEAVAGGICDKLKRRHPHVFGERATLSSSEQSRVWENIKAQERAAPGASALHGVPHALPALLRADKLSKRAARVGFDFEQSGQCADKVAEELAEVRLAADAVSGGNGGNRGSGSAASESAQIFEEIGDLLFAAANLARKLDVDPEAALRAANAKFERRFRAMESLAAQRGEVFSALSLAQQEELWQAVKRDE
jgi:ATP diphosphatase